MCLCGDARRTRLVLVYVTLSLSIIKFYLCCTCWRHASDIRVSAVPTVPRFEDKSVTFQVMQTFIAVSILYAKLKGFILRRITKCVGRGDGLLV